MVLAIVQLIDSTCWALICKHRPDFISTCEPDFKKFNEYRIGPSGMTGNLNEIETFYHLNIPFYVDPSICQSVKTVFDLSWSSFPSGHVAFAICCSTYLALWLMKRHNLGCRILSDSIATEPISTTTTTKRNGIEKFGHGIVLALFTSTPGRPSIAGMVQILVGFGLSLYVAISRYEDYKHSFMDIVCSAVFGAFMGWLGFGLYHSDYPVIAKDELA